MNIILDRSFFHKNDILKRRQLFMNESEFKRLDLHKCFQQWSKH